MKYCSISSSTWYDRIKNNQTHSSSRVRERPVPTYTINPNGSDVMDSTILSLLKGYRDQIEFRNAGGFQKIKHYIRRDHGFFINGKKLYRQCKKNKLLLPHNKKKIKSNRKICTNKVIDGPNQL